MKKLVLALILLLSTRLPAGSLKSGTVTCASSGNKVVLSSATKVTWAILMGGTSNTGKIYIGDSAVDTTKGAYLLAGDSLMMPPVANTFAYDLGESYFACTVNTDVLTYLYLR